MEFRETPGFFGVVMPKKLILALGEKKSSIL